MYNTVGFILLGSITLQTTHCKQLPPDQTYIRCFSIIIYIQYNLIKQYVNHNPVLICSVASCCLRGGWLNLAVRTVVTVFRYVGSKQRSYALDIQNATACNCTRAMPAELNRNDGYENKFQRPCCVTYVETSS